MSALPLRSDDKTGWLKLRGGLLNTWQRRFFVLSNGFLCCYSKEDRMKQMHRIHLIDARIHELPIDFNDLNKYLLEVSPALHEQSKLVLCASSKEERDLWILALKRAAFSKKGGAMFGQSLDVTLQHYSHEGQLIPNIVVKCVSAITNRGLDTEGIFRVGGRATLIKELKEKCDSCACPDLESEDIDVHTVASLLKLYLRELPEPLIPFRYFNDFVMMATKLKDAEETYLDELRLLVEKHLPTSNYCLMQYVCQFLHRVSGFAERNKMTASNLAVIFSPSFARSTDPDPKMVLASSELLNVLVRVLIERHEQVLSKKVDPAALPRRRDKELRPHPWAPPPPRPAPFQRQRSSESDELSAENPSLPKMIHRPRSFDDLLDRHTLPAERSALVSDMFIKSNRLNRSGEGGSLTGSPVNGSAELRHSGSAQSLAAQNAELKLQMAKQRDHYRKVIDGMKDKLKRQQELFEEQVKDVDDAYMEQVELLKQMLQDEIKNRSNQPEREQLLLENQHLVELVRRQNTVLMDKEKERLHAEEKRLAAEKRLRQYETNYESNL